MHSLKAEKTNEGIDNLSIEKIGLSRFAYMRAELLFLGKEIPEFNIVKSVGLNTILGAGIAPLCHYGQRQTDVEYFHDYGES